jgi:hypothetical protein
MDVRSRAAALAMGVWASCLAGCTVAPPVTVTCTSEKDQIDIVGLHVSQGKATLLSVSPPLAGTVQASPTEYDVLFQPGPAGTPRLHLKINRYTFRMTREPGAHAADAGAAGPSVSTGTCERYRVKPL